MSEYDFQVNIYDAIDLCTTVIETSSTVVPFSDTSTQIGTETFSLPVEPSSAIIFVEGLGPDPTTDFSLSGSNLTVNGIRRIGDKVYGYLTV